MSSFGADWFLNEMGVKGGQDSPQFNLTNSSTPSATCVNCTNYTQPAFNLNMTSSCFMTPDFFAGLMNGTLFNPGCLWKLKKKNGRGDGFKQVLDFLNLYFTPVIILVGVVGNIMSFLVFSTTHLTRLSSSVYLAALSVADTGFLIGLSVVWLSRVGVPIFMTKGWCQCTVYFTHMFSFLSVWTVVSFTAERYIIVYHPLRKDSFCTRKKAKVVVCALGLISLVMYSYTIWTSGVVTAINAKSVCMPLPLYYDVITIMTSIDTVISCLIPSVVIVILNVRILLQLHHYQKKRAEMSTTTVILSNANKSRRRSFIHTSISTTGSMHIKFPSANKDVIASTTTHSVLYPDNCKKVMRNRSQFRTARMLLILSSVFVLLNLPSHVFRVQVFLNNFIGAETKSPKAKIHWEELFQLVYFLNFAINFFVYNACGRQFRDGLRRMCGHLAPAKKDIMLRRVASQEKLHDQDGLVKNMNEVAALVKPNCARV